MRLPVVASFLACAFFTEGSFHGSSCRADPQSPRGPYPTVRYKRTTICETTGGVNSYSGYIDLDEQPHLFFWFFEARQDPETAPITLWLNGGPGSDSLLGLFTEVGPCTVNPDLTTTLNPFSWSETSNLLFLSQPLGVGFSYGTDGKGTFDGIRGTSHMFTTYYNILTSQDAPFKYPLTNATATDTTELAATEAWQAIQAFLAELPRMNPRTGTRDLNLWTESYGGHYGPAFFKHFYTQNELIRTGENQGVQLGLGTLGIGNGIIDATIQFPMASREFRIKGYPTFAVNNTYGIQSLDDQVVNYMEFASSMYNGCRDQIYRCRQAYGSDRASIETRALCSRAADMCRDNVEGPFYKYSGRSMYDIRKSSEEPAYTDFFIKYLNLSTTQDALGVDLLFNYAASSNRIYSAFQLSGDYVYPGYLEDMGFLLDKGVRIVLMYGDADYIGNWFGGEAVSLAVNYSQSPFFRLSTYKSLDVNGFQHGKVREYGNFSFAVVYDAGHMVPTYKPDVALEIFRRSISGVDIATGLESVNRLRCL